MRIDIRGAIIPNNEIWIYDFFGVEHTAPKNVSEAMANAGGEPLDIYINSGGGDVFSGSEIYSAIRDYAGEVNIHVTGIAASAASVIACAGASDIAPTAQVMVHNVSATAKGDYRDMQKAGTMCRQADRAIASAYMAKTGMSEKDALDLMDAETWLTAQDAVDYGLIDRIAESKNSTSGGAKLVASAGGVIPEAVVGKMKEKQKNLINFFMGGEGNDL